MTLGNTPHWVVGADRIRSLHALAIERTGGAEGEQHPGTIESASDLALHAAMYVADAESCDDPDHLVYVSHLLRILVCDHAFVDGNKRVGWMALCESLGMDGLTVEATQQEAADFANRIAGENPGERVTPQNIAEWLAPRIKGK